MILTTVPLLLPHDLDRSIRFYTETLGFTVAFQEKEFVELRQGSTALWFHADRGLDDKTYESELQSHKRGIGVTLNFEVNDVDEVYQRVMAKGAKLEQALQDTPWGTKRFTVRDPDGYHLSFFSYQ